MIRAGGAIRYAVRYLFVPAIAFALVLSAAPTAAQEEAAQPASNETQANGTNLSFGSVKITASTPLQVVSDELQMDQNINTAIFVGEVMVEHGDLVLNASRVEVEYGAAQGATKANEIIMVTAIENVTMTSPEEIAQGDLAVYTIADDQIVVTGNAKITQGLNTVAGNRMVINLDSGTAVMEGRVRTFIDTNKISDDTDASTADRAQEDSTQ